MAKYFGNDTFTNLLQKGECEEKLYLAAIEALAAMHNDTGFGDLDVPAYDDNALMEEANLLIDWYYPEVKHKEASPAVKQGYNVCIITGGNSPMVKKRLNYLGVNDVYMEAGTKTECLDDYCKRKGIERSEILYMGDDVPDYHVMQEVGVSTCPKDAATEILSIADYVSDKVGGKGAVRDVIEQTMRLKGDWFKL